jgi:hypothetical protein
MYQPGVEKIVLVINIPAGRKKEHSIQREKEKI